MPMSSKLALRDAYCSASPLTSSFRPPRISRAEEARRPHALLQRPVKQEIRCRAAHQVRAARQDRAGPSPDHLQNRRHQDPAARVLSPQPPHHQKRPQARAARPTACRPCAKYRPASWAQRTRHVAEAGLKGRKVGRGSRYRLGCQHCQSGPPALRREKASPR